LTLSSTILTTHLASDLGPSVEGGFVQVGVSHPDTVWGGFDRMSTGVDFGERSLSFDGAFPLRSEVFFHRDHHLNDINPGFLADVLNLSSTSNSNMVVSIIPPSKLIPSETDGGMVGPIAERLPMDSLPSDEILPEAGSFYVGKDLKMRETPGRVHEIVPSRGREVFFEVATLAPPQTIVRPERLARGLRTIRLVAAQSDSLSPGAKPSAVLHSRDSTARRSSATESPAEATVSQQPTVDKGGLRSQPESTSPAVNSAKQHDRISSNWTAPVNPLEAVTSLTAAPLVNQSATGGMSEKEAHYQVFADWRTRDLIALPLFVAMTLGPQLARSLRSRKVKIQQLPKSPKIA
jgi:hypothetical protein